MRFDLVDLRLFLNVAEAHSITRGAQRSNMALASASARISGMEEALGVPLLKRQRHGVSLLPAGQCLVEHARVVTQQMERLRGDLGAFARGLAGSVHLLANTSALSEHLPRLLAQFLASNPTLSLDVEDRESADIGAALLSGMADVGIASAAALPDGLQQFPFRDDELALVACRRDPIARKRRIAFADVVDRNFIGLSRESALQRHIAAHAARLGVSLNVRARMGSFESICRLVEAGAGVAIVPKASAARYRHAMSLAVLKLADRWAVRRLAICVRKESALPAGAIRLVEHLRRSVR